QDAKPFGYVNENDEWVGYSIDILTVIQNQLGKALKQSIKLELVKESLLFFSKILGINNSYQR
nr:transporter substrate-binding domain-containing protein [Xenococcaceae cyanobacterium MO_188.B19]